MIDLKERPDLGWNMLLVGSLIGIGAAIWYGFLLPIEASAKAPKAEVKAAYSKANSAADKGREARKAILAKSWDAKVDTLGSRTLALLTTLADKHNLQLTGFRTDRASPVAGITSVPSVVTVEGTFPDTMAFASDLEGKDSKLTIQLLQVTSSESTAGNVTATLGLVGFVFKEKE